MPIPAVLACCAKQGGAMSGDEALSNKAASLYRDALVSVWHQHREGLKIAAGWRYQERLLWQGAPTFIRSRAATAIVAARSGARVVCAPAPFPAMRLAVLACHQARS